MKRMVHVTVNGEFFKLTVEVRKTLADFLRDDLNFTGVKKGCDTGDCGACTVIMNGKCVNSCLILAIEAEGSQILTIEGLSEGSYLHPLQEAFIKYGAIQCGYCTPGMILTAKAFLDENPNPSEFEVRKAISGNLCRCTGYKKIIEAIMSVSRIDT